jgi:hypothetical protein
MVNRVPVVVMYTGPYRLSLVLDLTKTLLSETMRGILREPPIRKFVDLTDLCSRAAIYSHRDAIRYTLMPTTMMAATTMSAMPQCGMVPDTDAPLMGMMGDDPPWGSLGRS